MAGFWPEVTTSVPKGGLDVTPAFISGSIIIFSLVVGVPIPTNAQPVKMMNWASADGLFTLAQTRGMERRQDRRDSRQDCRQQEGAVGMDKRNCKQERRQQRAS
jgi:hypothetical protein